MKKRFYGKKNILIKMKDIVAQKQKLSEKEFQKELEKVKSKIIGRHVDLKGYYPKRFDEKKIISKTTKRVFKISPRYPFIITDILKNDKNKISVNLKLRGKGQQSVLYKPLRNVEFQITEEEANDMLKLYLQDREKVFRKYWYIRPEDILSSIEPNISEILVKYIFTNKLDALCKKFPLLKVDILQDFLRGKYGLKKNVLQERFVEIENIGYEPDIYTLVRLFCNLYKMKSFRIVKSNNIQTNLKHNHISFIFFDQGGYIKDIYLDKQYSKIFFLFHDNILLIPVEDKKAMLQQKQKKRRNYTVDYSQI